MIADDIRLETDSEGYELHVDTPDGTFVFNVHGQLKPLIDIGKEVEDYFAEGRALAREHAVDLAVRQADIDHDRLVGDA